MAKVNGASGFKETEIGYFPREWEVVRVGDLADVKYGKANPRSEGTVPVVGSGGIFAWTDEPLVEFPTLVVGRKGTAGKVWLLEGPSFPSDTAFYLVWKREVDLHYLHGCMSLRPLSGEHAKTTLPSLQRPDLENYLVPLPPLPEQRGIAHVLSTIQRAMAAQDAVIAAAREVKRSLMQRLFTYGPYADSLPTRETEIGEVPEHWQVVKLGDVTESSAFGPRFSGSLYDEDGNVAVLRTTDLDASGNINFDTMPRARIESKMIENHALLPGDFLVTRSGTCGIAAVFTSYLLPVLPGAFLIRFRLKSEAIPLFLREYFNSARGQVRVSLLAAGAVQKNISGTSLLKFAIPLPPLSEQRNIAESLDTTNRKIAVEERRKSALQALFKSMLHELMTGKVRVAQHGYTDGESRIRVIRAESVSCKPCSNPCCIN